MSAWLGEIGRSTTYQSQRARRRPTEGEWRGSTDVQTLEDDRRSWPRWRGRCPSWAKPAGHVTGIGGVFVKSKDPKALAPGTARCLALDVEAVGRSGDPLRRARASAQDRVDRLPRPRRLHGPVDPRVHDQFRGRRHGRDDRAPAREGRSRSSSATMRALTSAGSPGSSIPTARRSSCGSRNSRQAMGVARSGGCHGVSTSYRVTSVTPVRLPWRRPRAIRWRTAS